MDPAADAKKGEHLMRMHAAITVLAAVAAACGGVRFIPDCMEPNIGDRARPAAIIPLSNGLYAGLNADADERFCGGFVTLLDRTGEVDRPFLLPVGTSWEGNFVAAATTTSRLWIAGRRLGTLLGVNLADYRVDVILEDIHAERVFYAGGEVLAAWRLPRGETPRLAWFDDSGRLLEDFTLSSTTIFASAFDEAARRLWLAGDGSNVLALSLDRLTTVERHFPFGLNVTYNLRGLLAQGGIVWATDATRGIVVRWLSRSGSPLDATPLAFRPEAITTDPLGRLWVVDAIGDVYVLQAGIWRRAATGLKRPVGIAADADGAWVADFTANRFVRVAAP